MVWGPRASTSLVLLAPSVFWENRAFCINSEDFPESWISAQKRDTRAVLLKTTLVRVSCIQNTQIRGKTIAKVFGKVDTFWTYHMLKNWKLKITFWLCVRCFLVTAQNLFLDSTSPNIISFSLENHSKKLNKYVQVSSNHNMQRMSDAGIPPPKLRLLA